MNQAVIERLRGELTGLREQGLYKSERVLAGPQGGVVRAGERDVINLCANNYLGLANHPVVRAAAQRAIDEYGYGMASVRFICGTQTTHKALEQRLARFLGTEDVILYSSCFDANGGLFETLLDERDAVISDALNHASYIDARREVIEWLRQRSRPYLFSNSIPPVVAAASLAVLELLEHTPQLRAQLFENTRLFRAGLARAGFDLKPGEHPIIPVMIGDAALAGRMADRLLERGVYVIGFSYPVVPKGQARIRTQMSAALTREQLESAVDAFTGVGRELGVL